MLQDFENIKIDHRYNVDNCLNGTEHTPIHDSIRGESICSECGLVLSEHEFQIDIRSSFFSSNPDLMKSIHYCNPVTPLTLDISMSTTVDKNIQSESLKHAMIWNNRYSWKQRHFLYVNFEIRRVGELLNVPRHAMESAVLIYRKAYSKGLIRGRSIRRILASSLYCACRIQKVSTDIKEIALAFDLDLMILKRFYLKLCNQLMMTLPEMSYDIVIAKSVARLNLNPSYQSMIKKVLQKFHRRYITISGNPVGVIGAIIYFLAMKKNEPIIQSTIAQSIGINEVTLRQRLKQVRNMFIKQIERI